MPLIGKAIFILFEVMLIYLNIFIISVYFLKVNKKNKKNQNVQKKDDLFI